MRTGQRKVRWLGFVMVVAVSVLATAWTGWRVWRWKVEREVQRWVESYGGTVSLEGDDLRTPPFIRDRWGPLLDDIVAVSFSGSPGYLADEFSRLQSLRSLKVFSVSEGNTFGDSHLEVLATCRSIERVCLTGTSVTEEGFRHFGKMKRLTSLKIGGTDVDSSALNHLADLSHLQSLELNGWRLGAKGTRIIAGMRNLRVLRLTSSEIEDPRFLAELVRLEELHWKNSGKGGVALPYLSRLPGLVTLHVDGLVDSDLPHLEQLASLKHLDIEESEISIENLERLARSLPGLEEISSPRSPGTREEARRFERFLDGFKKR